METFEDRERKIRIRQGLEPLIIAHSSPISVGDKISFNTNGFVESIKQLNIFKRFINWLFSCEQSRCYIYTLAEPLGLACCSGGAGDMMEVKLCGRFGTS